MKRLILAGAVGIVLAAAIVFSQNQPGAASNGNGLKVEAGDRNPWTHLRINNNPSEFRFIVVSDRTGGHREKIFSRAVEQINLLQPEFVLSVGDLIEGYTTDADKMNREWREFQGFVNKLQMPFFYVSGNHDLANPALEKLWNEKFGKRYYHFVYKDVLFLVLCSDDPPESSKLSDEQVAQAKKALEENANVRWTFIAIHRPVWAQKNLATNGWLEIEKALAGRKYTVFAGHIHRYQHYSRQGMDYYQLATTGGGSRLRGLRYGEFDHVVQVTMKQNGPVLANIMLDGVLPADLVAPETNEPVVQLNRKPCHPVRGTVHLEGVPAAEAVVVFFTADAAGKKFTRVADSYVEPDGSFVLSTYTAGDGAPLGDYIVVVSAEGSFGRTAKLPGGIEIPAAYTKPETSPLKVQLRSGRNEVKLDLTSSSK